MQKNALLWWVLLLFIGDTAAAQEFDLVLSDAHVIDGTGNPWFEADIGIRNGLIVAVGDLKGRSAARRMDLNGLTVAPGFIDLHSHADGRRTDGLRSEDAEGVVHVLVGGAFVVTDGALTWALPGVVITPREGRKPPTTEP